LNTLHRYILRQVLAALVMTVLVFTFVLLLGTVLKQLLDLMVGGAAGIGLVAKAIALVIPYLWIFSLPMGMLTATLLVFGRLSADQELTAARASGISLISLVWPVLALSVLLCGLSAWVNLDLGPRCRVASNSIIDQVRLDVTAAQLPEGRYIKDFKGYILYVGKNHGGELENVMIFALKDETNFLMRIDAARGKVSITPGTTEVRLQLTDTKTFFFDEKRIETGNAQELNLPPVNPDVRERKTAKAKASQMTFLELRELIREAEALQRVPPPPGLSPDEMKAWVTQWRKRAEQTISPMWVQLHRQLVLSFACFGFTLIGIPLGIRVHRRETNVGFFMALILVGIYYGLLMAASALDRRPELVPHLLLWLPNFIFQGVGIVLLWRANRGV
jgi:lipopolysaccharide export LptBFGC system permease protein LptF